MRIQFWRVCCNGATTHKNVQSVLTGELMKFFNTILTTTALAAANFVSPPAFAKPVAGTVVSVAGWRWQDVIDNMDRIKNAG